MLNELIKLALSNLNRARTRLAMTAGGVLVGTAAVILLVAMTIGLQRSAEEGIGSSTELTEIYVYTNYDPQADISKVPTLSAANIRKLWAIPNTKAVIAMTGLRGGELVSGKYSGYARIVGISPDLISYLSLKDSSGQVITNIADGTMLVGPNVGNNFYDPNSSDYKPIRIDLTQDTFKIRMQQANGETVTRRDITVNQTNMRLFQTTNRYDEMIFVPLTELIKWNEFIDNRKLDPKTFTFDEVRVQASSRETVSQVFDDIRKLGFSASGMIEYINQLNSMFATMRIMLGGIGGIALLVAAFGVANTMTMAILERTKEIGIMKAIGATDRDVLTVFLIEASLVGFIGGLSGVGISLLLQNLVNQAIRSAPPSENSNSFLPFDVSKLSNGLIIIPPELVIFGILLATLVGLVAGTLPAIRAAKLQPVHALKSE